MRKNIIYFVFFLFFIQTKVSAGAVDELVEVLKNGDNLARIQASEKLVNAGPENDVRLIKALNEKENENLKYSIIWILGEWGEKKYFEDIILFLDKGFWLSRVAIVALGKIGDKRAIPEIAKKLGAKSRYVRTDAVYSLGKIGDKKALPHIINVKDDPDWHVREAVAVAMGQLGTPNVKEFLKKMANNDLDALVRIAAYDSLEALGFEANN